MTNDDDITAGYERHVANIREAIKANKAAVFEALAAAGITFVTAEFDGEGDSGGISEVSAGIGDMPAELPAISILFQQARFGTDVLNITPQKLRGPSKIFAMTTSPRNTADGKMMTAVSAALSSRSPPEPSS
jgi:hypothetical protein